MVLDLSCSELFESGTTAPRGARQRARRACHGLTSPDFTNDVAVVVSELVTNALRHGAGGVRLVLRVEPGQVFVAVHDEGRSFD